MEEAQELFVDYQPVEEGVSFPEILFYDNPERRGRQLSGLLIVPRGGMTFIFRPVTAPTKEFKFRDLCVHPVDVDDALINEVEFEWFIRPEEAIWLKALGRFAERQIFSYTLSIVDLEDGTIVYRDPEVVNTGGP